MLAARHQPVPAQSASIGVTVPTRTPNSNRTRRLPFFTCLLCLLACSLACLLARCLSSVHKPYHFLISSIVPPSPQRPRTAGCATPTLETQSAKSDNPRRARALSWSGLPPSAISLHHLIEAMGHPPPKWMVILGSDVPATHEYLRHPDQ